MEDIYMPVINESLQEVELNGAGAPPHKPHSPQRWRWYHGLAFYAIAQVLTFGLQGLVTFARSNGRKTFREALEFDRDFYTGQKQPKFAPPPWLFGPAWTINNISVIYGNLRVLNMPETTQGRDAYLKLQALSWLDYVIFTSACFGLRSNINGAIVTISMFGLTIASLFVSIFRLKDTRVALSLATLFTWLTLASALSATIALWNRDELYDLGPFAEPSPLLLK
jgi:tryptophan-rich sensory protein